jgi:hypothetical protein
MRIPSGTTDRYIYFVAVDSTDLKTRETGLSSFTVYYEIANGTATAMTTPTVTQADATNMPGVYTLLIDESGMTTLTSGHDTAELCLHITQASMAPVTRVIEIYRAKFTEGQSGTMANSAVDADLERVAGTAVTSSGGRPEVNVSHAAGTAWNSGAIGAATLASDTIAAAKIATGAITNAKFAAGAIDAAAIAADAIGASELAADAVTEIQSGLATSAALATVDTVVGTIQAKTDQLTFGVANTVNANITYVNEIEVTGDGETLTPWNPV